MVKTLEDLERDPLSVKEIKDWAEEVMDYMFAESQKNLTIDMPWGDAENSGAEREWTKISDTGFLLLSGERPKWDGNKITFSYTAMHAEDVEYGSPPKYIDPDDLTKWVKRKLKVKQYAIKKVAKRVSDKIAREGIEPHPYIRPAVNSGIQRYKLKVKPMPL